MRARVEDSTRKYQSCKKAMQDAEKQAVKLEVAVRDVKKENERLQEIHALAPRIEYLEREMR